MRLLRNLSAGVAAVFTLAAIVSFIVNFNDADALRSVTFGLGILGGGFGMVGLMLTMQLHRDAD